MILRRWLRIPQKTGPMLRHLMCFGQQGGIQDITQTLRLMMCLGQQGGIQDIVPTLRLMMCFELQTYKQAYNSDFNINCLPSLSTQCPENWWSWASMLYQKAVIGNTKVGKVSECWKYTSFMGSSAAPMHSATPTDLSSISRSVNFWYSGSSTFAITFRAEFKFDQIPKGITFPDNLHNDFIRCSEPKKTNHQYYQGIIIVIGSWISW
jgi:hypothetical protein